MTLGQSRFSEEPPKLMRGKTYRNPKRRRIHPEMVSGHKKYAPKYAAWRPDDLDAVMFSVVWK